MKAQFCLEIGNKTKKITPKFQDYINNIDNIKFSHTYIDTNLQMIFAKCKQTKLCKNCHLQLKLSILAAHETENCIFIKLPHF